MRITEMPDMPHVPNTTPLPRADAELMFMAHKRLMRVDPAGDREGTLAEALMTRLWDAGYRLEYIGSETILKSPGA
jgi:hypothetical protein